MWCSVVCSISVTEAEKRGRVVVATVEFTACRYGWFFDSAKFLCVFLFFWLFELCARLSCLLLDW